MFAAKLYFIYPILKIVNKCHFKTKHNLLEIVESPIINNRQTYISFIFFFIPSKQTIPISEKDVETSWDIARSSSISLEFGCLNRQSRGIE